MNGHDDAKPGTAALFDRERLITGTR